MAAEARGRLVVGLGRRGGVGFIAWRGSGAGVCGGRGWVHRLAGVGAAGLGSVGAGALWVWRSVGGWGVLVRAWAGRSAGAVRCAGIFHCGGTRLGEAGCGLSGVFSCRPNLCEATPKESVGWVAGCPVSSRVDRGVIRLGCDGAAGCGGRRGRGLPDFSRFFESPNLNRVAGFWGGVSPGDGGWAVGGWAGVVWAVRGRGRCPLRRADGLLGFSGTGRGVVCWRVSEWRVGGFGGGRFGPFLIGVMGGVGVC